MKKVVMLIALLSVSLCVITSAAVWNLNTDMNATTNEPNGIWTYGYALGDPNNPDPNAIPTYEDLMVPYEPAPGIWIKIFPDGAYAPHIWFGTGGVGVPADWHGVKPGAKKFGPAEDAPYEQAPGVFRWTAPAALAAPTDIYMAVSMYPPGANSQVEVYIVKSVAGDPAQRTVLLDQKDVTLANPLTFAGSTHVAAGDTIDFMVGPQELPPLPPTEFSYQMDWTAVSIAIYDYQPVVCQAQLPMDFNWDCYVNLEDFALFAQSWLACNDQSNPICE